MEGVISTDIGILLKVNRVLLRVYSVLIFLKNLQFLKHGYWHISLPVSWKKNIEYEGYRSSQYYCRTKKQILVKRLQDVHINRKKVETIQITTLIIRKKIGKIKITEESSGELKRIVITWTLVKGSSYNWCENPASTNSNIDNNTNDLFWCFNEMRWKLYMKECKIMTVRWISENIGSNILKWESELGRKIISNIFHKRNK